MLCRLVNSCRRIWGACLLFTSPHGGIIPDDLNLHQRHSANPWTRTAQPTLRSNRLRTASFFVCLSMFMVCAVLLLVLRLSAQKRGLPQGTYVGLSNSWASRLCATWRSLLPDFKPPTKAFSTIRNTIHAHVETLANWKDFCRSFCMPVRYSGICHVCDRHAAVCWIVYYLS